jgi:1-acyl-sn-glycerol-3-phosphate acyltransferase
VARLAWVWLRAGGDPQRLHDDTAAIQRWWTGLLAGALRVIFSVRFELEGEEHLRPGPLLVFIRHSSLVDTLLPTVFITARHGLLLRFVLKRELLADPCLDIAGNRLRNHFVGRDGSDSSHEIAAVRALAEGLGPNEGVLIYPEGTRFTERKRSRALEALAASDPALAARAQRLRHLLPPRTGGPLALLESPHDVLLFGHHGLDGLTGLAELWSGRLVGARVRMRLWRVRRSEIPDGREAQVAWLYDAWARLDDWLAEELAARASERGS